MQSIKKQCLKAVLLTTFIAGGNTVKAEITECTEIPFIPYTIVNQGVYCLKHNLSANLANGSAITVATNNVTIDFNGFKLGNLAAGAGTSAIGVYAINRSNIIIRNGVLRGYYRGVYFSGSTGGNHLVEDMRLDGNTYIGILSGAPDVTLRDNTIVDTGGTTNFSTAYGLLVTGAGSKIIGNDISRVFSTGTSPARGIRVTANNVQVLNNSVSQLSAPPASFESYIFYSGQGGVFDGNRLIAENADGSSGISINGGSLALCSNTKAVGFNNATSQCGDGGGNVAIN